VVTHGVLKPEAEPPWIADARLTESAWQRIITFASVNHE
jgi:hypothetical protein